MQEVISHKYIGDDSILKDKVLAGLTKGSVKHRVMLGNAVASGTYYLDSSDSLLGAPLRDGDAYSIGGIACDLWRVHKHPYWRWIEKFGHDLSRPKMYGFGTVEENCALYNPPEVICLWYGVNVMYFDLIEIDVRAGMPWYDIAARIHRDYYLSQNLA